jgi:hypothetical protein
MYITALPAHTPLVASVTTKRRCAVGGSTIAQLNDTCGNLIQITQLARDGRASVMAAIALLCRGGE